MTTSTKQPKQHTHPFARARAHTHTHTRTHTRTHAHTNISFAFLQFECRGLGVQVPSAENSELSKISFYKPGVGQNIAFHVLPTTGILPF